MTPVAKSYAESLFTAAESLECLPTAADELEAVQELLSLISRYLGNPRIKAEEKISMLLEMLTGKVNPLILEFLLLLIRRRHIRHLASVTQRFRQMCNHHFGKSTIRLSTPYPLDPAVLEQMKSYLIRKGMIKPGRAADAEFQILLDKDLIGGFVATCDGVRIDASLKTELARLTDLGIRKGMVNSDY